MKASILAEKLLQIIDITGEDLDVNFSEIIGAGKEVSINSIAYNCKTITLANYGEYE